jgi:hypothetical protein
VQTSRMTYIEREREKTSAKQHQGKARATKCKITSRQDPSN